MKHEFLKKDVAISSLELLPWISTRNLNEILLLEPENFLGLDAESFDELGILRVYAGLLSTNCDGFDVAQKLQNFEFSGQLTLFSSPLPQPKLVEREFKMRFKKLQIELAPFPRYELN